MFQQNQVFDNTYLIRGEIGKGGTGTVFLAWHLRLQKNVVLKQINVSDSSDIERVRIEVDTLKSLHHQSLPQVYDFIQSGSSVYTVMDYVEGTDLSGYLKQGIRPSADDMIRWFSQLTEVLVYLHKQTPQVIHSDIKPANIIITPSNDAVLIDFNVSVSKKADMVVGLSVDYASPEQINLMQQQINGVFASDVLDGRSDIYSLCASFYHLISMRRPSVFYGTVPLADIETEYPEVFCEIIDKGMQTEKEDRYSSAEELARAVNGIWKKSGGYKGYLAAQIAVIAVSALLLSGGIYLFVKGTKEKEYNEFIASYNRCILMINNDEPDEVIPEGMALLNTYSEKLEKEPEKKGDILLGIARSYEEEDDPLEAFEYYSEAKNCFDPEDYKYTESLSGSLSAALKSRGKEDAEEIIESAEAEGEDEAVILLLKAQLEQMEGNDEACLSCVNSLEKICDDDAVMCRAYLAAAECTKKTDDKLSLLKTAAGCAGSQTELQRRCGYSLMLFARDINNPNMEKTAYEAAADCYKEIVEREEGGVNDHLNLADSLLAAGKPEQCLSTLDDLENSKIFDADPGIIYMHKAFAYSRMENASRAKEYARQALQELNEADVSPENLSALREMAGK